MEDGQIILPDSEDLKNGLVGQIRDYTVIRTTALGQPVYSQDNEHTLVAWMLSILAATMEFSDINKQNRAHNIAIGGKFGEKVDKDFKVNRNLVEEEKRKRLAVNPRWFGKSPFQETTARNTLDNMRTKTRFIESSKKKPNPLSRLRKPSYSGTGGRATF